MTEIDHCILMKQNIELTLIFLTMTMFLYNDITTSRFLK